MVTLQPVQGTPGGAQTVRTDSYGAFAFSSLAAGAYTVRVSKMGFLPTEYGQKRWNAAGTLIALTADDGYLLSELRQHASNGIAVLKGEIELNLHKQPAPAVSITTGGGSALVNLGQIYGNVQQVIGNVGASGQAELAEALRELTEAINGEDSLGDERAEFLEQVGFLAEQSTAPAAERKLGVVKGTLRVLRAGVQDVSNVAQILSVAGPIIAHHFGLPWPI